MNKHILFFIVALVTSIGGYCQSHNESNQYEYDNLNRLTKVIFNSGIVFEYQYDNLGNRIGKTIDVQLDNSNFTITSSDIDGCNEGELNITATKRNYYHVEVVDTNANSLILSEDFSTNDYSTNLDVGDYEVCITINDIPQSTFEYCTNINISDVTDISSINSNTFSHIIDPIEDCQSSAEITITASEEVDCHPYIITLEDENGNQLQNLSFTDTVTFDNLSLGSYTYCIVIEGLENNFQECVNFEIIDETDTSSIGYNDFNLKAYGNFYNSQGNLELNVSDFLPCHEYSYFFNRLSGNAIPSDDIGINPNSNIYINNLSFGEYELYIDVENIDPSVFRLILYISISPEDDEVIAYDSCSDIGILNYILPDNGFDYESTFYLENGSEYFTLTLPNQGLTLLDDVFYNNYFTVNINRNQSENEFFFYNCFVDDYEPFLVVEEISYTDNPTITLNYSGGIRPYWATIYHPSTNTYEANFEQHNSTGSLTYNLKQGRNEIALEHADSCSNFYKEIFIPTEFILYPNPTSVILNIGAPTGIIQENSMIGIYDMSGKQIELIPMSQNSLLYEVNVTDYSGGTYIVRISNNDQESIWSGRFIKK